MTQAKLCAPSALSTFLAIPLQLFPLATTALVMTLAGSVTSAAPLQSGTYSFTINSSAPTSGTCTGPGDDGCIHDLTSVTIGATTYSDFTFPSAFTVGGFPMGSNVQSRIQGVVGDFVLSSPTYEADMLANVFSDTDLNRYQQVDSGAGTGFSTFTYPDDVPATSDFFFITTERDGNNDQIVQAFDSGGNPLGSVTVNGLSSDYTDTGVNVGLSQNGFISVIPMSDFNVSADPLNPSQVRSLRISYTGNDGADHKTFIVGTQTTGTIVALADDFSASPVDGATGGSVGSVLANDTLGGSGVATDGSQTTLIITDADGLTGVSISDNGTITVPAGTPNGTYNVVYQLCDELSPTNCDTATATVVVGDNDLLDVIEEDLTAILEDDLAATIADQGARMGDYAAGALERLRSRTGHQCAAAATLMAQSVLFDTDKAIIKPESDQALDEIAAILATCNDSAFEISGHTDSRESDSYNIALSQRRVDAVLRELAERGIDTSGFTARGYGERRPVASNTTVAGMAQNRRVEFALIEKEDSARNTCGNGATSSRAINANTDEAGVAVDGSLFEESHDCTNDRWSIVEGTVSYLDTDSGLERNAVNLSYRRERFVSEASVRGYFVGVYRSQSDVNREATGEIDGAGLNAGIYGATRLQDNLFLDYYLGAATGVHDFDLEFDDPLGAITATGDYSYVAGFLGAALSGDLDYGEYALSPRAGIEIAYAPGGDADVEAARGAVIQSGSLDLESVSGSAIFAEFRTARAFNDDRSLVALTPRLTCYQSLGSFDGECSVGASLELASSNEGHGTVYALEIEGEHAGSFTSGAISARVSWPIGTGRLNADADVTQDGAMSIGGLLAFEF